MFVVSETWEGFLNLPLSKIEKGGEPFLEQKHLHDLFREELVP